MRVDVVETAEGFWVHVLHDLHVGWRQLHSAGSEHRVEVFPKSRVGLDTHGGRGFIITHDNQDR